MVRPYQKNNLLFNLDGVFVASTGYAQLRNTERAQYVYHFLQTKKFVRDVISKCTGTGYPAINANDLAGISIDIPHPDEQQKIAHALSSIDNKFRAVANQIHKMEAFKKSLLQNMFV